MKRIAIFILSFVFLSFSPAAKALEVYEVEITITPDNYEIRVAPKPSVKSSKIFGNAPYEALCEVIPPTLRHQEDLSSLKAFIDEHLNNPCVYRRVLTSNPVSTFILVFKDIQYAKNFMVLEQKLRDPRWPEGVTGIIEYTGNLVIEAKKLIRKEGEKVIVEDLMIDKPREFKVFSDKDSRTAK